MKVSIEPFLVVVNPEKETLPDPRLEDSTKDDVNENYLPTMNSTDVNPNEIYSENMPEVKMKDYRN